MAQGKVMRQRAKKMQSKPTEGELRAGAILELLEIPVKEQIPIGRFYIADFIGKDRPFVLEIDGPSHLNRKHQDYWRDTLFKAAGFKVVRIKNEDVSFESLRPLLDIPICGHQKICSMIWYAKLLTKYPQQQIKEWAK